VQSVWCQRHCLCTWHPRPTGVIILLGLCYPPRSWTGTVGPTLPSFTIAPCVDSLLGYRSIRWPKSILQDSPKIYGMCMHSYNRIWVVLLISRLNLAFVSPKLSRGIDVVLVCLCPCGFDNLCILLGESCYNCTSTLADYSMWLKDCQQVFWCSCWGQLC
jgi:hypothetical protein